MMLFHFITSVALLFGSVHSSQKIDHYEAPEPFEYLNGVVLDAHEPEPASPDPLVRVAWNRNVNASELQIYRVYKPVAVRVDPPDAAIAINEVENEPSSSSSVKKPFLMLRKSCSIMLDWGVERAAWFEFISPNLMLAQNVKAAISEFNTPYPGKIKPVQRYGNSTYRLETNAELYEGVRFTWIYLDIEEDSQPIHITNVSLVAKVKPVNYTGSFQSSDFELTQLWYTGAYGVRLNMEANEFNSVLVERGDRVAIQGDGHPAMAAALVAFSPFQLISQELNQTNSGYIHGHHVVDDNIMAYPLYWTMSVHDWFMASGDIGGFRNLLPDIMSIIDSRVADFLDPSLDIALMGWDDRLGNGWCFHSKNDTCTQEASLTFSGLVIQACNHLIRSLDLIGMESEARFYTAIAANLTRHFREIPEWPRGMGVHSAANAINANVANKQEINLFMSSVLNDPVTICSWSQFNQFWILQAFGNIDEMEYALASMKLCWGSTLELGKGGCFWEYSSPEWNSFMKNGDQAPIIPSYCHPWSSGITAWQTHVLGGIEPLLPGYEKFAAGPYVSAQYPSVSTTISSPFGTISVNATLQNEKEEYESSIVVISITTPVPGFVGIRKTINSLQGGGKSCVLKNDRTVLVNGTIQILIPISRSDDNPSAALLNHVYSARAEAFLFAEVHHPGSYVIAAAYHGNCTIQNRKVKQQASKNLSTHGIPHIPPFSKPHYPASVTVDRYSQGDGLYKHGADGYVLLGYDNAIDQIKLPSYIHNVSVHEHGYDGTNPLPREYIGMSTNNLVYLPHPLHGDGIVPRTHRALGMVGHDTIHGSQMDCVIINIELAEKLATGGNMQSENSLSDIKKQKRGLLLKPTWNQTMTYSFSIYTVAKTRIDKQAIRVLDLHTLNVIAPTIFASNYQGGVWWTIKYNRSIRLRIMGIQGSHVSAVAFSSVS